MTPSTEQLQIMLQFICNLAYNRLPLVFKGGVIFLEAIKSYGVAQNNIRMTTDVDADWTQGRPSMQYLTHEMDRAAKMIHSSYYVLAKRPYKGTTDSASFVIMQGQDALFKIDICVRDNQFGCIYKINNQVVQGASVEKMMADKLSVISSPRIYRRCKDLFDVYALSFISGYKTDMIFTILQQSNRQLGAFAEFKEDNPNLLHAYEKLQHITNKPTFHEVFARVAAFTYPFRHPTQGLVWNGHAWNR